MNSQIGAGGQVVWVDRDELDGVVNLQHASLALDASDLILVDRVCAIQNGGNDVAVGPVDNVHAGRRGNLLAVFVPPLNQQSLVRTEFQARLAILCDFKPVFASQAQQRVGEESAHGVQRHDLVDGIVFAVVYVQSGEEGVPLNLVHTVAEVVLSLDEDGVAFAVTAADFLISGVFVPVFAQGNLEVQGLLTLSIVQDVAVFAEHAGLSSAQLSEAVLDLRDRGAHHVGFQKVPVFALVAVCQVGVRDALRHLGGHRLAGIQGSQENVLVVTQVAGVLHSLGVVQTEGNVDVGVASNRSAFSSRPPEPLVLANQTSCCGSVGFAVRKRARLAESAVQEEFVFAGLADQSGVGLGRKLVDSAVFNLGEALEFVVGEDEPSIAGDAVVCLFVVHGAFGDGDESLLAEVSLHVVGRLTLETDVDGGGVIIESAKIYFLDFLTEGRSAQQEPLFALDAEVVVAVLLTVSDLGNGVLLADLELVQVEELPALRAGLEVLENQTVRVQKLLTGGKLVLLNVHLLSRSVSHQQLNLGISALVLRVEEGARVQHETVPALLASEVPEGSTLIQIRTLKTPLPTGVEHFVVVADKTSVLCGDLAARHLDFDGLALPLVINEEVLHANGALLGVEVEVAVLEALVLFNFHTLEGGLVEVVTPIAPQARALV